MSDTTIIVINIACIGFLVLMMAILIGATRFRGGAGWAAVMLATTPVAAYLSNLTRDLGSDYFLLIFYFVPLNLLCFPATWFFTRKQLDKSFRLTAKSLLHVIPVVISLAVIILYYAPMSAAEVKADMAFMESGGESLPALVNDILLGGQFFAYFAAIFFYCRKRLRFLQNNYSDSDFIEIRWTIRFLIAFFICFIIALAAYAVYPRSDIWMFPIMNTLGMAYLVYIVLFHSTQAYLNRLQDVSADAPKPQNVAAPTMNEAQMKEICERVKEYLQSSKTYINPDLSIIMLSSATGIHHRNISIAINGFLRRNFFDLVNEMRVGEAKRLLLSLEENYTIESVYPECGFRSRSAFFAAFRKFAGTTPTQWLKNSPLNKQ